MKLHHFQTWLQIKLNISVSGIRWRWRRDESWGLTVSPSVIIYLKHLKHHQGNRRWLRNSFWFATSPSTFSIKESPNTLFSYAVWNWKNIIVNWVSQETEISHSVSSFLTLASKRTLFSKLPNYCSPVHLRLK